MNSHANVKDITARPVPKHEISGVDVRVNVLIHHKEHRKSYQDAGENHCH
jgi:hypothetical protein